MDLVYPYDGKDEDTLALSVATFRKFWPICGTVYVIGPKCPAIPGAVHVAHPDARTAPFTANVVAKLLAACDDGRVSDPFLAVSDDVFMLRQTGAIPLYYSGTLAVSKRAGSYGRSLRATCTMLQRIGVTTPLNFETHTPRPIHKAEYRRAMATFNWRREFLQPMSVYGNLQTIEAAVGDVDAKDVLRAAKPRRVADVAELLARHRFCSTGRGVNRHVRAFLEGVAA
jgi:hypothetical protein